MNMISRRHMVKGLAAGLPLAVVLADPLLARVAAGGLETVTIPAAGRKVSGSLALPPNSPGWAMSRWRWICTPARWRRPATARRPGAT